MYKKKFGTPIGSLLSPIIAEIVLQNLEKKALGLLSIGIHHFIIDMSMT